MLRVKIQHHNEIFGSKQNSERISSGVALRLRRQEVLNV
jgi:hypothetical protein